MDTKIQQIDSNDRARVRLLIARYLLKCAPSGSCIADVADAMGIDKSSVSGRINELKKMGVITIDGARYVVEFVAKRRSYTTGVPGDHYRLRMVETKDFQQALKL